MDIPRRVLSPDGLELQLATNSLGHFALTARLLDGFRASTCGPRVVNLGSLAPNPLPRDFLLMSVKPPPCAYLTERELPRPPSRCLANGPTSSDQVQ
ncbi:hypothetical protein QR77_34435 [Streptomyces sp. 150FB]|uniref:hypothetical protein n=1 Tax=Streptomyces sp. 150FB TaxID=1576605 RepID=UPI000588EE34|nr:hypothetical protein [Streptomyces sp. 150FB]KIF77568.1 hypothetical protein QR77_34435 [Streptomyces sp. 150FB]